MVLKYFIPAVLAFATVADATELRPVTVRTGTAGLEHLSLTIANDASEPITCTAEIAHWYSLNLAMAAPGTTAAIDLWFDPETGSYAALNDKDENLPVERLWCGLAGRAYATRSQIRLDRGKAAAPAARRLSCAVAAERLVCR